MARRLLAVTPQEASWRLGCSVFAIYRRIHRGQIAATGDGAGYSKKYTVYLREITTEDGTIYLPLSPTEFSALLHDGGM